MHRTCRTGKRAESPSIPERGTTSPLVRQTGASHGPGRRRGESDVQHVKDPEAVQSHFGRVGKKDGSRSG